MNMRSVFMLAVGFSVVLPLQAEINCSSEVTDQVAVSRGGYRLIRRANVFVQEVVIRNNTSSTIQGPIGLVLQNLTATSTLSNGSTTNPCGVTGPSTEVSPEGDNSLSPGESLTVRFQFANPSLQAINYTLRIYSGQIALAPLSGIEIAPDALIVNQSTSVTVKALASYSGGSVPTVTLERVDLSGNLLQVEGAMVDNGNLSQGDEIQGDGIFTLRKNFLASVPGQIRLRIKRVNGGSTTVSEVFLLTAFNNVQPAQIQSMIDSQAQWGGQFATLLAQHGGNMPAAIAALLAIIKADPAVENAGTSDNSLGIWVAFKTGLLGGLMLNPENTRGGPAGAEAKLKSFGRPLASGKLGHLYTPIKPGNLEVKSKKVAILSPFLFQFGATDEGPTLNTLYSGLSCPKYDVLYRTNGAVTVDVLRSLKGYGVIHIATHGDTYYKGHFSASTQTNYPNGVVVFFSGQTVTVGNYLANLIDLLMGRLAIMWGGSNYYVALPSFVSAHMSLDDGLVFNSSCRSSYNTTLSNAFIGKGAKTYLGFTEYVSFNHAFNRATTFHNAWAQDSTSIITTGEAFVPPLTDPAGNGPPPQTGPAVWSLRGATNLEAPNPGELQNGDFETGALGAWTSAGDGRVIPQLGHFLPRTPNFMGIISTGLGFTTSSGSISQRACIAPNTKTLTFDWNYNSEEFLEYCGSIYQDFFSVDLISETGAVTNVFHRTVDQLCGSVSPVAFSFDRGGVYSTGWLTQSINIGAYATANGGKPVTIRFSAGDVGDSIYDTAILLDKIKLNQ